MAGASPSLSTLTGERHQHFKYTILPIFCSTKVNSTRLNKNHDNTGEKTQCQFS